MQITNLTHSVQQVLALLKAGEYVRGGELPRINLEDGVYAVKGWEEDLTEIELVLMLEAHGFAHSEPEEPLTALEVLGLAMEGLA